MVDLNEIKYTKTSFISAKGAEASPPLGTVLGNLGVNTIKFCEEFNIYTNSLPTYFLLKVIIFISENRTFKFKVYFPSISYILNLLKFEKIIKILTFDRFIDKIIDCIYLQDLIQIALFKFPNKKLSKSILILLGIVKSMNIKILK